MVNALCITSENDNEFTPNLLKSTETKRSLSPGTEGLLFKIPSLANDQLLIELAISRPGRRKDYGLLKERIAVKARRETLVTDNNRNSTAGGKSITAVQ